MDSLARIITTLKHLDLKDDIEQLKPVQSRFGSTCDVFMGQSKKLKKNVAVKRIRLFLREDEKFAKKLAKEIRIWALLKHECVLPFLGYYTEGEDAMPSLVSLWMGHGTVDEYMKKFPRGGEETRDMLCGIASGLSYLHSREVIHADLKSKNVLISDDCKPLLADFGISTCLTFTKRTTTISSTGTVRWMAIELFGSDSGSSDRTSASDVWSFGMVAYELLSGVVPYNNESDYLVPTLILKGVLPNEPVNANHSALFSQLWEVCGSCWKEAPRDRPTSAKLYEELDRISETIPKTASITLRNETTMMMRPTSGGEDLDPEHVLESPTNSSSANSSTAQLSKEHTNTAAQSPSASTLVSKMRHFTGQRLPSERITTHLPAYLPYMQPKVPERTPRQRRRKSNMDHDSSEAEWTEDETGNESIESSGPQTHLLPPMKFSSESFSDSLNNVANVFIGSQPSLGGRSDPSPLTSRYMAELRALPDLSDSTNTLSVNEITTEVRDRRKSTAFSSLRSSESNEKGIGKNTEVYDEPETVLDTTEDLVAAADGELEEEEGTLDGGGSDVVNESILSDSNRDVEPVKSTGGVETTTGKRGIKWTRGALIGTGSFGQVYLGMDTMNGNLMAVKQVPLPSGTGPNEERKRVGLSALEREIDFLKDLQHKNIVQYLDSSSDDQYLYIFLEYVPGGAVSALLRNYGAFEEALCCHFVRQILQGLSYLHDRDIIHCNIKGANILVDNKGGIKISDFGISKVEEIPSPLLVPQALAKSGRNRESFKGTVFWMAPEAVQQKFYTQKADIWSVGCLIVEMLTGQRPWPNLTEFQAIFKVGMNAKPQIPADISHNVQKRVFTSKILVRDASK